MLPDDSRPAPSKLRGGAGQEDEALDAVLLDCVVDERGHWCSGIDDDGAYEVDGRDGRVGWERVLEGCCEGRGVEPVEFRRGEPWWCGGGPAA